MNSSNKNYRLAANLFHWLLALVTLGLLGSGWYATHLSYTDPARGALSDFHISLGLTGAIILVVHILLRIVSGPASSVPGWRRVTRYIIDFVMCTSFVLLFVSGWLLAAWAAPPVQFWGISLPLWTPADTTLGELFGDSWGGALYGWGIADETLSGVSLSAHSVLVYVLVGSIILHAAFLALQRFERRSLAAAPLIAGPVVEAVSPEAPTPWTKRARGLARNFRIFGWLGFWVQFVLALASALLLQFAASGQAISPGAVWSGEASSWGLVALILLCLSDVLAFLYTRAANKISLTPENYLKNGGAFWLLGAGVGIGSIGIVVSFVGVALSIVLLIAKTVSQPPGIAITDPNKIIRALDIFALLANFNLLGAHFIATGIALWLSILATRAHLKSGVLQLPVENA